MSPVICVVTVCYHCLHTSFCGSDKLCVSNNKAFLKQQLPGSATLWNYFVEVEGKRLDTWDKLVAPFRYDRSVSFFKMLVPTVDTARFGYLLEKLLSVYRPVLYTGGTGVGKVCDDYKTK